MGKKLTELEKAIRVVESTMGVLAGPGSAQEIAWSIVKSAAVVAISPTSCRHYIECPTKSTCIIPCIPECYERGNQ